MGEIIYTIGHSILAMDAFLHILDRFEIRQIVDVRTIARSRRNPQYNEEALREALKQHGIAYSRLKELGGLRREQKASINTAWKNASFRGYADYMQTPDFSAAIGRLIALAGEHRSAIMCAEAVPWRCHRSLIGDALLVRGMRVEDIFNESTSKPHLLTSWAHVDGTRSTSPGAG